MPTGRCKRRPRSRQESRTAAAQGSTRRCGPPSFGVGACLFCFVRIPFDASRISCQALAAEEQATQVQEKQSFLESLSRTASTCFGHGILLQHERCNGGVSIMTQTGFINAQWNCGSRIARSLRRIANSVVFHLVGSNPTCRATHQTNGIFEQKRR